MICLVHGYGLTGSGSNQWTRSIAEGMVENGEAIHLICQENMPSNFDFVSDAYTYGPEGNSTQLFQRNIDRPGRCTIHRPQLDVLPTYVRPKTTNASMACILDMRESDIDEYIRRNVAAVRRIFSEHDITSVHVNHVVLMAIVIHRVCTELRVPYGVMPHGSAIEYVVRKSERMKDLAGTALDAANRIFTLSDEMADRIRSVFPDLQNPERKMVRASAGVDTKQFRVIGRKDRPASIARLKDEMADMPRGKSPAEHQSLTAKLHNDITSDDLVNAVRSSGEYAAKRPDVDLGRKLDAVDWEHDETVTFVGKVAGYKGVASIIAAFPAIAARRPRARLLIIGRGNLREGLEALVWALGHGNRRLVDRIVASGGLLEGETSPSFDRVGRYLDGLRASGHLDSYFDQARRYANPERILFTGYMEHHLLRHLFPCCDVAVFPSIVKEAAPLVVPEALASGCFPIGTDFAGMRASLDVASRAVPDDVGRLMRVRPDPEYTVSDIVDCVSGALDVADEHRNAFRELAVGTFDWRSVAGNVARELNDMVTSDSIPQA